jgi:RNA polymerase sigma-70 factor (ECF subfamily)
MKSDRELLLEWAAGSRDASSALIERHYPSVYSFFSLRVPSVADDLSQTTFLACVERHAELSAIESFRSFLFGVARHKLQDHLRRKSREQRRASFADVFDTKLSTSRIVASSEEQQLLLRALQELPLDAQVCIELFYWQGFSVAEIARVLEVPVSTVTTRLSRHREALRAAIQALRAPEKVRCSLLEGLERWASSLRAADVTTPREENERNE